MLGSETGSVTDAVEIALEDLSTVASEEYSHVYTDENM